MSNTDWLMVPMEVSALVAGIGVDRYFWSDLSPDYSKICRDFALVGPDLVTLFPQGGSSAPPGKGIHLHWFLPEAFGHGVESQQGPIEYPPIPNRWLVRRVRYARNSCKIVDLAGWIVEGDHLHKTASKDGVADTVSFPQSDRPSLFDSVGRVTPLQDWTENNPAYRFTLTALGPGSPDFAAHYPSCKGILGFYDESPSLGETGSWQISYFVTGWCSDPAKDLLYGVTADRWKKNVVQDVEQYLLDELRWSQSGTIPPAARASRVLCHGGVGRVAWNAAKNHVSSVPGKPATVYVGNTSAEALAALIAQKAPSRGPDASSLEPLLCAFQYDMLGSAHALDDVHAELHRHRFTSWPGGDRYTIDAKRRPVEAGASATPGIPEQTSVAPGLPPQIESALHDLNRKAGTDYQQQRKLDSLRQALFTTWCLWAKDYTTRPYGTRTARTAELIRGRATVADAILAARAAQDEHRAARESLESSLARSCPDLALACATAPPFYRATDPAVVVAGKGFRPSGVFVDYTRADHLPCRRASEIVSGLCADFQNTGKRVEVFTKDLFAFSPTTPLTSTAPPSDLLDALLREFLFLEPVDPQQTPPAPAPADLVTRSLEGKSAVSLSEGALAALKNEVAALLTEKTAVATDRMSLLADALPRRPDAVAGFRWAGNPWRPTLVAWEVQWYPDSGLSGERHPSSAWRSWSLDASGNEFQWPCPTPPVPHGAMTYQSYTMLAPHAEWVLRRRQESLPSRIADEKLKAIFSCIDRLDALSFSLGGFHDALRQLRHGLQLPPINPAYLVRPDTSIPKLDAVLERIDGVDPLDPHHMHAPDLDGPGTDFLPIRAGQMEISRLWLVDSFGQTHRLIDNNPDDYAVFSSFGLPGPSSVTTAPRWIPLPPRYVQPARVDLAWLPAAEGRLGGSPICGWVLPNHLDKSLIICDAAGRVWGALQRIIRIDPSGGTGGTRGRESNAFFWVPTPGTETEASDIPDATLREFVDYLLHLDADTGSEFLDVVAASQADAEAAPEHDPRLSILIGKPLALARASIRIELMGSAVRDIQSAIPPSTSGVQPATDEATPGFTEVEFPIRLGGPNGQAGGLAGYFVVGKDHKCGPFFPGHEPIDPVARTLEFGHEFPLDAKHPVELILLLDPAAPFHVRCGLLPRTSFQLPERAAAGAEGIREVFFQSAPLVGPPGAPRVPRPSDDYGQWSWATRPPVTPWREYADIADPGERAGFGQSPMELHEGWLKLAMSPVRIAAFWVKQGAVRVTAGTRVTLGWMVEGADTLTLSLMDAGPPLKSWTRQPGSNLPEEYALQIFESVRVSLTAMDQRGNHSVKFLRIDVG